MHSRRLNLGGCLRRFKAVGCLGLASVGVLGGLGYVAHSYLTPQQQLAGFNPGNSDAAQVAPASSGLTYEQLCSPTITLEQIQTAMMAGQGFEIRREGDFALIGYDVCGMPYTTEGTPILPTPVSQSGQQLIINGTPVPVQSTPEQQIQQPEPTATQISAISQTPTALPIAQDINLPIHTGEDYFVTAHGTVEKTPGGRVENVQSMLEYLQNGGSIDLLDVTQGCDPRVAGSINTAVVYENTTGQLIVNTDCVNIDLPAVGKLNEDILANHRQPLASVVGFPGMGSMISEKGGELDFSLDGAVCLDHVTGTYLINNDIFEEMVGQASSNPHIGALPGGIDAFITE